MRTTFQSAITLALFAACLIIGRFTPLSASEPGLDGKDDFHTVVQSFLAKHCVTCHGADRPKGDFHVQDLVKKDFDPANVKRWQKIVEMVDTGDMPPAKRPQPSDKERHRPSPKGVQCREESVGEDVTPVCESSGP